MKNYTFAMVGSAAVAITICDTERMVLDEENLVLSIQNVTERRHEYRTEKGWLAQLNMRKEALDFLRWQKRLMEG